MNHLAFYNSYSDTKIKLELNSKILNTRQIEQLRSIFIFEFMNEDQVFRMHVTVRVRPLNEYEVSPSV